MSPAEVIQELSREAQTRWPDCSIITVAIQPEDSGTFQVAVGSGLEDARTLGFLVGAAADYLVAHPTLVRDPRVRLQLNRLAQEVKKSLK